MATTPPVTTPSISGIALLGGALTAGAAATTLALNGSQIWLVLVLIATLAWPLWFFPVELHDRGRFVAAALGLYGPIVTCFYVLSYGRDVLGTEPAHWLIGGSTVAALGALAELFCIPAARRALPWFTGALVCGLLISFFSGGRGSGEPWKEFLVDQKGWDPERAEMVVVALRKTIHFTFYGLLSLLTAKGVRSAGATAGNAFRFAVLWVLFHAAFDEGRQAFLVDRSGSGWDVLLDLVGAIIFTSPFLVKAMRDRNAARSLRPEGLRNP